MNLWIAVVVAVLVAAPISAHSETLDYTLYGWGYAVSSDIVSAHIQLDLKDATGSQATFEQGYLVLDEKNYPFNGLDFVFLQDQRMVKINGMADGVSFTATGRLAALHQDGAIYDLKGHIIKDNVPQRLFLSTILVQAEPTTEMALPVPDNNETDVTGNDSEKQDILLLVRHKNAVQWMDRYDFTVRVFDPPSNPSLNFYHNFGFIEGIGVSAKITDPVGREIRTINGTTDNTGYFTGSVIIPDNSFPGSYVLDVSVQGDGFATKSQQLFFQVIQLR